MSGCGETGGGEAPFGGRRGTLGWGWVARVLVLAVLFGIGIGEGRAFGAAGSAAAVNPDEFRAAFLSKIPRFVNWPEKSLPPAEESLVIALLGGGTFLPMLEGLLKDVRVGERGVVVKVVEDLRDLPPCQILFVPESRVEEFGQLSAEKRSGLLTVGEKDGFTKIGGVFNLSLSERKLTVNIRNARAAGLELQSRLLRIAEVER